MVFMYSQGAYDMVTRIKDKAEQKKVIVASGAGDKTRTLPGTAPMMSAKSITVLL